MATATDSNSGTCQWAKSSSRLSQQFRTTHSKQTATSSCSWCAAIALSARSAKKPSSTAKISMTSSSRIHSQTRPSRSARTPSAILASRRLVTKMLNSSSTTRSSTQALVIPSLIWRSSLPSIFQRTSTTRLFQKASSLTLPNLPK